MEIAQIDYLKYLKKNSNLDLYTTKNEIKLLDPIKATRARLTLEVNKEGNLITSTNGLIEKNRDFIDLYREILTTNSQTILINSEYNGR